jgi:hypothetical protein
MVHEADVGRGPVLGANLDGVHGLDRPAFGSADGRLSRPRRDLRT